MAEEIKQETTEEIKARQDAEQAVVPPPPAFMQSVLNQSKETPTTNIDGEDKILLEGSDSEFWKILKRFIEAKQKRLTELTAEAVRSSKFDLQEVGFRYLIQDQVVAALQDVINKVEFINKVKELEKKAEQAKKGGVKDDANS